MRSPRDNLGPLPELWPELAEALKVGLQELGEGALAAQVPALVITSWHDCGDDFCHSFTVNSVDPRADGDWREVEVAAPHVADNVVVSVLDDQVAFVEIV